MLRREVACSNQFGQSITAAVGGSLHGENVYAFNRDLSTFYGQHRLFSIVSAIWGFFFPPVNSGASLLVRDLHHTREEAMNAGKSMCVQKYKPGYESM